MVRFARSGGEANSISIRIARAATGRDKIAICGYHGWHDWYLAANLTNSENLEGHLLSGLEPAGVPSGLEGSAIPFDYNNFDSIKNIVSNGDVGVIMMEVSRNMEPKDNFLQNIRELATDNGIVLIFDECTSGFRQTFGGLHKKYGVEPDMAVFGKALGNGPIGKVFFGLWSNLRLGMFGLQLKRVLMELSGNLSQAGILSNRYPFGVSLMMKVQTEVLTLLELKPTTLMVPRLKQSREPQTILLGIRCMACIPMLA